MSVRSFFCTKSLRPFVGRSRALIGLAVLTAVLAGCSSTSTKHAPVESRSPKTDDRVTISTSGTTRTTQAASGTATAAADTGKTYTVRQGDTLYSIALHNELDYRDVATWNNITDPSKLSAGQVLRLSPPGGSTVASNGVTTAPLQTVPPVTGAGTVAATEAGSSTTATTGSRDNYKTEPKAVKEPYSEQALAAMSKPPVASGTAATTTEAAATEAPAAATSSSGATTAGGVKWSWPTQGKVITTYSEKANLKGIDIVGSNGQPVVASADGRVVYVGSGLRGYGKMVIVKHNDTFLSVYAHNQAILVEVKQQVTRGQKIAEMGNTDADQVKLHFEVRKDGKPVDPMQYLPAR